MTSYCELVIGNLKDLRLVALFHPRLAYLGVARELEIMYKEINPCGVWKRGLEVQMRGETNEGRAETTAARSEIREIADARGSSYLFERDGRCAHSRERITFDQANGITQAIALVEALRTHYCERVLDCKGHSLDYRLGTVLDAAPGQELNEVCPEHGFRLWSYKVPEWADVVEIETDRLYGEHAARRRERAVHVLSDKLREEITLQFMYEEITKEEYVARIAALQTIAPVDDPRAPNASA